MEKKHRRVIGAENGNYPAPTAARRDAQLLLLRCGMNASEYARMQFFLDRLTPTSEVHPNSD
jgi:hypothetical protein